MANLIELQGTEKQIAWANKIRKEIIDEAQVIIEKSKVDPATDEATMAKLNRVFASICAQSQAKWWIDHKSETGRSLIINGMKGR